MNVSLARSLLFFSVAGFVAGVTGCGGPGDSEEAGAGMPPPPVTAVEVRSEDVAVEGNYTGRVRGAREVEVRARVGGILEERLHVEGAVVERGDVLFQIETEPFEIALRQAEADLANARANLSQAEREWRRVSDLYEQNAVSERERDRALSDQELAEAGLQLAEARQAEARLNLDYTRVQAPISGPTGLETLSEGSLIERGTLLTTIVQHDPVHVRFSLPETDAEIQRAARRAMSGEEGAHRREAHLVRSGGETSGKTGEVDFTDSTVDPRTGSVSARAVFSNPDGELLPGQFVRIRVLLQELEDVFRIEPSAVGEGGDGPRVFVLNEDDTVSARKIRLGPFVGGKQVVLEGLEDGDRLVVNGHVGLQDGMTVASGALEANGEVE